MYRDSSAYMASDFCTSSIFGFIYLLAAEFVDFFLDTFWGETSLPATILDF